MNLGANIVRHRLVFYLLSVLLVAASLAAIGVWGLNFGVDFSGGSLAEIEFTGARPDAAAVARSLDALGIGPAGGGIRIQPTGERGLILRFRHVDEPTHAAILAALGPEARELRFDAVGPTIGRELRERSVLAIGLVILLIVAYIAWAFRKVSSPAALGRTVGLASWKYGLATVVALAHDVVIPTGFAAVAGRVGGAEVGTLFVTAILTILGFSVHDTIVVFDRIRENLQKRISESDFEAIVGRSISQTLARSVNTSLTVALAMVAILIAGGESTRFFAAVLLIGTIVGTYSSICIASPILVSWHQWQVKNKNQILK